MRKGLGFILIWYSPNDKNSLHSFKLKAFTEKDEFNAAHKAGFVFNWLKKIVAKSRKNLV